MAIYKAGISATSQPGSEGDFMDIEYSVATEADSVLWKDISGSLPLFGRAEYKKQFEKLINVSLSCSERLAAFDILKPKINRGKTDRILAKLNSSGVPCFVFALKNKPIEYSVKHSALENKLDAELHDEFKKYNFIHWESAFVGDLNRACYVFKNEFTKFSFSHTDNIALEVKKEKAEAICCNPFQKEVVYCLGHQLVAGMLMQTFSALKSPLLKKVNADYEFEKTALNTIRFNYKQVMKYEASRRSFVDAESDECDYETVTCKLSFLISQLHFSCISVTIETTPRESIDGVTLRQQKLQNALLLSNNSAQSNIYLHTLVLFNSNNTNSARLDAYSELRSLSGEDSGIDFKLGLLRNQSCLLSMSLPREKLRIELKRTIEASQLQSKFEKQLLELNKSEISDQFFKDLTRSEYRFYFDGKAKEYTRVKESNVKAVEEAINSLCESDYQRNVVRFLGSQLMFNEAKRVMRRFNVSYHQGTSTQYKYTKLQDSVVKFDFEYKTELKMKTECSPVGFDLKFRSLKWKVSCLIFQSKLLCTDMHVESELINSGE
ncbi:hypothetical protein [Parashewanella spongiae]|nr:hypothetical protein [Parashewanella spongiae]